MKLQRLLLIFAMCLIAALSMGQGQRRGGMFRNGQMGFPASLLNRSDVKNDLNLTADQKSKLDDINQNYMPQYREIFQNANGDFEAANKQRMELSQKQYAEELKVLTSDETGRLTQISIQLWSFGALLNKDLQTQLGLSDTQKSKIDDLNKQMQDANAAVMQKIRSQEINFQDAGPIFQKNTEALKSSIGDVLTADQKTKYTGMGGKTFTPDPENAPGGGGGGGR